MGIGQRKLAGRLLGLVGAPHLRKADEEALRRGVAVYLVVDGLAFLRERVEQSQVGDAQAAIVGGVLAQRELAVQVLRGDSVVGGRRLKAVVLLDFAIGALVELLAIVGSLPLAQVAVTVIL